MSNYRVRQVLKLHRKQRVEHFLLGLATFMDDRSRTVDVGTNAVMEAADQARNTFREARREAEKAGDVISEQAGVGRGHVTRWTVLCLPEVSPEVDRQEKGVNADNPVNAVDPLPNGKGVNADNPVNAVDPLPNGKGVKPAPERGSNGTRKGGQGQRPDQQKPDTLNLLAKPSGSLGPPGLHARLAASAPGMDVTERETGVILDGFRAREARGEIRSAVAVMSHEISEGLACGPRRAARASRRAAPSRAASSGC